MRKFSVFTLILFMIYLINANSESYDFSQPKTFNYEKAASVEITDKCYDYLQALSQFMVANPSMVVRVEGHSDNMGTYEQNEDRAYKRTIFIVNYLMNEGVDADRIFARGVGSRMPIADNREEKGRALNRRVSITVENTQRGSFPNKDVEVASATGAAATAAAASKASQSKRKAPTTAKKEPQELKKEDAHGSHSSHDGHGHHYHSWHVAVFNGATTTHDPMHTSYTIGLEAEYRLPTHKGQFGVGLFAESIFTEDPEYLFGSAFFLHPEGTGGLKFLFGAGILFAKHAHHDDHDIHEHKFVEKKDYRLLAETADEAEYESAPFMRLGVGYDIHLGNFALTPVVNLDMLEKGKVALNYGLAIGYGF